MPGPGDSLRAVLPEFKKILEQADLIISKGQGNFECLEQLRGPFFFLLKAKCRVVSRYLGVPQGSLIIMMSHNYSPGSRSDFFYIWKYLCSRDL